MSIKSKFWNYSLFCWLFCVGLMVIIDYLIGDKAEFLNAWSVVQRIIGMEVSSTPSMVYTSIGATGEFLVVLLINLFIASILSFIIVKKAKA